MIPIPILRPYLMMAGGVALALVLAWGMRNNYLRAHYKEQLGQIRTEYAAFKVAIIDKTATYVAQQKEKAIASDLAHEKELADARDAADRYIATHRLRAKAGSGGSTAPTSADTGVSEIAPANAIVVSEGDIHACTESSKYAMSAHEWAISVNGQ